MTSIASKPSVHESTLSDGDPVVTESVVLGREGCMISTTFPPRGRQKPALVNCETLGFVRSGRPVLFVVDMNDEIRGTRLDAGSLFRVPPTIIHWMANVEDEQSVVIRGLIRGPGVPARPPENWPSTLSTQWEDTRDFMRPPRYLHADRQRYGLTEEAESTALKAGLTGLVRLAADVPVTTRNVYATSTLTVRRGHGNGGSLMVGDRPPGYHTTPHVHAAEQLNIVGRGLVRGYCMRSDDEWAAVECQAGGGFRFPYMSAHWAWNVGTEPLELIELHVPALNSDDPSSVGLFGGSALEPEHQCARNIFVEDGMAVRAEVEAGQVLR